MTPHEYLEKYFGFREFLDAQEEVINAIVDGSDALVVMPTGGGKSLCYQLPALILEGTTVVVSPLIALMKDQVDALERRGIAATLINSSLSPAEQQERIRRLSRGDYKLVYIAPERFRSRSFVEALGQATIAPFRGGRSALPLDVGSRFSARLLSTERRPGKIGTPAGGGVHGDGHADCSAAIFSLISLCVSRGNLWRGSRDRI